MTPLGSPKEQVVCLLFIYAVLTCRYLISALLPVQGTTGLVLNYTRLKEVTFLL